MANPVYLNPADHPGVEPFLSKIAENGKDNLHKLVFSDWLEENGYTNAARGMRWAAKYNKRPLDHTDSVQDRTGWASSFKSELPYAHSRLPDVLRNAGGLRTFISHSDKPLEERATHHWADFLHSAHHTNFDEANEPLPRLNWNT